MFVVLKKRALILFLLAALCIIGVMLIFFRAETAPVTLPASVYAEEEEIIAQRKEQLAEAVKKMYMGEGSFDEAYALYADIQKREARLKGVQVTN